VCALFFRHGESKRGPTDRRASRALHELCPCPERRIQPWVHLSALRPIAQRSPICQIPPATRRLLPWLREKPGTNRSFVNLSFSYVLRKPTKKRQSVFLNALPLGRSRLYCRGCSGCCGFGVFAGVVLAETGVTLVEPAAANSEGLYFGALM
jgi:hypothetical protein